MKTCELCGSDRITPGPFHAPDAYICNECGHHVSSDPIPPPPPKLPELPEGGFSTPEEAMAHLAQLQKSGKRLLQGLPNNSKNKTGGVKAPVGLSNDLVMYVIHRYQRRDESWNAVLNDAKYEKSGRNDNVIVEVHQHSYGESCEKACRNI